MNINTYKASFAWEWFAQQRHRFYLLAIEEQAAAARSEVLDKIRLDFRLLGVQMRHRFDQLSREGRR